MKTRGFIYGILLILGLSLIGLLFYYGMWMLTDAYFRQEFLKEWPWHSWVYTGELNLFTPPIITPIL